LISLDQKSGFSENFSENFTIPLLNVAAEVDAFRIPFLKKLLIVF
jgi:hypothetical protein